MNESDTIVRSYLYHTLYTDLEDVKVLIWRITIQDGPRIANTIEHYCVELELDGKRHVLRNMTTLDEAILTAFIIRKSVNLLISMD